MKLFGSLKELVQLVFRKDSQEVTLRPNQSTTYTAARDVQLPVGDADHEIVSTDATQTLTNKTITVDDDNLTIQDNVDNTKKAQFQASGISTATTRTYSLPDTDDTVVVKDFAQELKNKNLNSGTVKFVGSADSSKILDIDVDGATTSTTLTLDSDHTANRTLTLPDATDTLVARDTTDTLTNKTLTSPTINTPSITVRDGSFTLTDNLDVTKQANFELGGLTSSTTRTINLPDADDTLVARATTDTLTNKTVSSGELTTCDVNTELSFDNQAEARFLEQSGNGTNYVGFEAPDAVTSNQIWKLPDGDGGNGQLLSTDGAGNLDWATVEGGAGVFNYVLNPGATGSGTDDTTVTGSFTRSQGTTESTFSDSYFHIDTGTTTASTISWDLDTLNEKHDGQLMVFSMRVSTVAATADTYKIGVYNSTDAEYVPGTELTLASGSNTHWKALFILDRTKTYVARLERTSGTTDEDIYVDDVTVTPEQTVAGASISAPVTGVENGGTWVSNTTYSMIETQIGEYALYNFRIDLSGAPTSAGLTINLPSGRTINTAALTASTQNLTGILSEVGIRVSGASLVGRVSYDTDTTVDVQFYTDSSTEERVTQVSATSPGTFGSGDWIDGWFLVPISEFSGTVQTFANNRVEYASNNGTWDADAGASTTTYGPDGTEITGVLGASRTKLVRFQTPIQPTDKIIVETRNGTDGAWTEATDEVDRYHIQNTLAYGAGVRRDTTTPATDVLVTFGRYRRADGSTFGAAGANWASGRYWRVAKSSNPVGIGTGVATATQPGAVERAYTETGSVSGTNGLTGSYKLSVINDVVFLGVNITASDSGVASWVDSALIPSAYRPQKESHQIIRFNDGGTFKFLHCSVQPDGDLNFLLTTEALANSNASDTDLLSERGFDLSWHLDI